MEVVRFYTFPIFVLSFLLGSILDHLGLHFGVVLDSFFLLFSLPRPIKKSTIFRISFFTNFAWFWDPRKLHNYDRIAGKSPPSGVQDHLDEVALIFCLSYLSFGILLGRFWHDFGRFWHPFSTDFGVDVWFFGPFSFTSGIAPFFFSRFRSSLPSSSPCIYLSLRLFIDASLYLWFLLEYECSLSSGMFVAVLFHSALLQYFIFSSICSFIAWRLQFWPSGLRRAIK